VVAIVADTARPSPRGSERSWPRGCFSVPDRPPGADL